LVRFWEGFALSRWVRSRSLNSLVYQRVLGYAFSDHLLEDCAPALPVICPSAAIVALDELRVCESGHGMM
jgi:hypothetical protein